MALGIPLLIAKRGLAKKSLTFSGAASGVLLAFFSILCHYSYLAALLAFFTSSSVATRYKAEDKKKIEGQAFKEGGQRNWVQVFCNGGVAFQVCLMHVLAVGIGLDIGIDFSGHYKASVLGCAYLGAISCCNGDTWASELGSVLSRTDPYLLTTWKKVPKGTNGGISIEGLICSFLGGTFVGTFYFLALCLVCSSTTLPNNQVRIILLGGLSGLAGSLIDSFLGATFQYSGFSRDQNCVVESPGPNVDHISGCDLLDNHSVNLFSSLLTALLTPFLARMLLF